MTDDFDPQDGAVMGHCDECDRDDVLVILSDNPFVAEIYPESDNPESWWCCRCFDNAMDEI